MHAVVHENFEGFFLPGSMEPVNLSIPGELPAWVS